MPSIIYEIKYLSFKSFAFFQQRIRALKTHGTKLILRREAFSLDNVDFGLNFVLDKSAARVARRDAWSNLDAIAIVRGAA